jgi:hypothetical protein
VFGHEGSSRFLKKAAQKFLLCWAMGVVGANAHGPEEQSFFATFCSQKVAFPSLPIKTPTIL